ncbi:MAG: DNA-binding transcriptional LysR family regulator [Myxococcota bacterium]|jgi:DNA-binding transcriptional LysR family regulator
MSQKTHLVSDLEVFVAIASVGSLAAAAPILQRSPSTLSRQLARLEVTYGTTLIRRTTRSASLTEDGVALLERAHTVLKQLDQMGEGLSQVNSVPSGRVRLSAPTTLGRVVVAPVVRALLQQHAGLEVSLDLSNRFVDLVGERFDVVIRITANLVDSGLRARKLGEHPSHLYRKPGPEPLAAPLDLQHLDAVVLGHGPNRRTWTLMDGKRTLQIRPRARLSSSSLDVLVDAATEGLGVAAIPDYLARPLVAAGRLERVLPAWTLPIESVWLLHAGSRSAAIDGIADGVRERIQGDKFAVATSL